MGIAVAPYLKEGPLRRALEGQAVDGTAPQQVVGADREFMIGATVPQMALWIGGTVGGDGRGRVGNVERWGWTYLPAFYLALLVEELRAGRRAAAAALIAAALALALVRSRASAYR